MVYLRIDYQDQNGNVRIVIICTLENIWKI